VTNLREIPELVHIVNKLPWENMRVDASCAMHCIFTL